MLSTKYALGEHTYMYMIKQAILTKLIIQVFALLSVTDVRSQLR